MNGPDIEAEHIRDLAQRYCDVHPGVSEERARAIVLEEDKRR